MLRSNPSALPDVRAWAATLLSLLIFLAPHARTSNAINLLDTHSISPFTEIPWLPFGKIYGAARQSDDPFRIQECHLRITGASRRRLLGMTDGRQSR
jgi:hypothetical protein